MGWGELFDLLEPETVPSVQLQLIRISGPSISSYDMYAAVPSPSFKTTLFAFYFDFLGVVLYFLCFSVPAYLDVNL